MSAVSLGGFGLLVIIIFVVVIALLLMGIKAVPQGAQWTVERFGRYTKTLSPGLNIIIPFVDRVSKKLSMMEEVMDIPPQEVITKDNAMVRVDGVVFYQVVTAASAAYEVSHLSLAMENLALTNIRTVVGSMDLDELLSKRDEINQRLLDVIDKATDPWGIKVLRVEIKDIKPPQDLVDSMTRQMKAEREKRASVLEADGQRQAEILKAEGEKQAAILEAEGRREAAYRDAEARERLALAEAKATQMMSEAINSGNIHAINYFVADKYIKALQEIASADNQKVIFMPLEAANIIGSLGGIAEIAKDAFHKNK
jgi:regulator of protease activity HflC (stomatin/prohibitin superfamily)